MMMASGPTSEMGSSSLSSGITKEVRPLIDLVDNLRTLGIEEDLPLPQIAVMGDQSSGKSSVLEALSGVPFPRGTGLVTRCPCVLTMKRTAAGSPWRGEVGVQRGGGGTYMRVGDVGSAEELTEAIERVTESLTEKSTSGFSRDSIVVTVQAADVPDLTIIDLPGIVRTVTAGQDRTVIGTVNEMIESYLKQERTIVLAIVPSNQDVATVDILERALRVDPTGERTIGVLTKPDLVDPGGEDEVVATLRNERKPLKLGYVMVKNRNAAELKRGEKMTGAAQAEAEKRYFRTHAAYSRVDAALLGIPNLTAKLTRLLAKRIEAVLPELKWELQEHLTEATMRAAKLGPPPPKEPLERSKLVLRIFADYTTVLRQTARGDYRHEVLAKQPELRLRTTADVVFHRMEGDLAGQKPDFEASDFTMKLHQELRALRGRELPGLLNSFFFYGFMARHVEMWRPLIERSKEDLYDLAFNVAASLAEEVLASYPGAVTVVSETLADHLEQSTEAVQAKIEEVFKHESDPFISKNELSEAILKVRFDRFEKALDAVMATIGNDDDGSTKKKKPTAEDREAQARDRTSEAMMDATAAGANDGPGTMAARTTGNEPAATAQKKTQWADKKKKTPGNDDDDDDQHPGQQGEPGGEHPMKEMVLASLGKWYMANHGVTSMSMVEDMRTVLIAYWGVASKRITENICMLFETFLLATLAEDVEQRLLQIAQENAADVVDGLLRQDEATRVLREDLAAKKIRVASALNALAKFAPQCVAKRPAHANPPTTATMADDASTTTTQKKPAGPAVQPPPVPATASLTRGKGAAQHQQAPRAAAPPPAALAKGANVVAQFTYTSNGDNNGFIYWLGTAGKREKKFTNPHDAGRVRVTSSGLAEGTEALLVSRKKVPCYTRDEAEAWICIDLGRNRALVPTHYTLLSGADKPGFDLLSWNLEGYDPKADAWVDLHLPQNNRAPPRTLGSPWGVATFELDSKGQAWRYLRLHHTGLNARGTNVMAVGAWEFYGALVQVG